MIKLTVHKLLVCECKKRIVILKKTLLNALGRFKRDKLSKNCSLFSIVYDKCEDLKVIKKLEGFCTQIASKVSLRFLSTLKNPKLEMRSFGVDVVYMPGRHTVDWYSHNDLGHVNR